MGAQCSCCSASAAARTWRRKLRSSAAASAGGPLRPRQSEGGAAETVAAAAPAADSGVATGGSRKGQVQQAAGGDDFTGASSLVAEGGGSVSELPPSPSATAQVGGLRRERDPDSQQQQLFEADNNTNNNNPSAAVVDRPLCQSAARRCCEATQGSRSPATPSAKQSLAAAGSQRSQKTSSSVAESSGAPRGPSEDRQVCPPPRRRGSAVERESLPTGGAAGKSRARLRSEAEAAAACVASVEAMTTAFDDSREEAISSCGSATSLQHQQRRLLPEHLQEETAAGDLLLESSVVDGYVMVPWSEHDADVRCNFYLQTEPPGGDGGGAFGFLSKNKQNRASPSPGASPPRETRPPTPLSSFKHPRLFSGGSGVAKGFAGDAASAARRRRRVSDGESRGARETGDGGIYSTEGCCAGFSHLRQESGSLLSDGGACEASDDGECKGGASFAGRRFARGVGRGGWVKGKWEDPEGVLALSEKQRNKHFAWRRLSEIVEDPVVFAGPPCSRSIRQGFMGDCSFLSSLAALSEYERAHGVPVLSGLIHPRRRVPDPDARGGDSGGTEGSDLDLGRARGASCSCWRDAAFNPRGIYGVRLFFNGVARKVLVDDYMPVRRDGKLLCAYSANPREVWVSILEKAFGKLMGGTYSVQGSNPGADLYHLTGWVPETVSFRRDLHSGAPPQHKAIVTGGESEDETKRQVQNPLWTRVWNQLSKGLEQGRCVACLGTSELFDAAPSGLRFPEGVSVSTGIVARHAYSVLRHAEVFGFRLLYVKNPWGCMRWKGKFSPSDAASWTDELKTALHYDPEVEGAEDAGCFWIEWSDVVRWFSHLYVCWNSSLFPFVSEIHGKWEESRFLRESSLRDDSYLVAFNPQFRLSIHSEGASASSFPPYVSFPSLLHADLQTRDVSLAEAGSRQTSVSACGEDSFCEAPVEVWVLLSRHIRQRHKDLTKKYLTVHVHEGRERLACPSIPTKPGIYSNGECTLLKIRLDPQTLGARQEGNGGGACEGSSKREGGSRLLRALEYVLVVSQYSQKDEFNFTLKVLAHVPTTLEPLPPLFPEDFSSTYFRGRYSSLQLSVFVCQPVWRRWREAFCLGESASASGEWTQSNAGGCSNDMWKYFENPQVRLTVPRPLDAVFFLESPEEHSVNIRVFPGARATARLLRTGRVNSSGAYRGGCCFLRCTLTPGVYVVICSTFKPGDFGSFQLCLHSAPVSAASSEEVASAENVSNADFPHSKREALALAVLYRIAPATQVKEALQKHSAPLIALREFLDKRRLRLPDGREKFLCSSRRAEAQLLAQARKLLESEEEARRAALPTLEVHPYPYAIPPDPRLYHQELAGPSRETVSQKREWSRVALVASSPALVSLRLEIRAEDGVLPLPAFPEMALYLFSPGASPSASAQSHLELVARSDLQGGLSADGKTRSSAALDLLNREGVLNITLAELSDSTRVYVAYICTPREAASEGRPPSTLPPLPWRLHVISTESVQICLL